MTSVGKGLMLLGIALTLVGAAVWGLGRAGFRGLPGDLRYESGSVRVYFPVVTCLVLSVLLSAAMWIWQWLRHR